MTPRTYGSPAAFKQAVEHRLREEAAGERGVDLARLRQLLVFDRFLARVTASFGERVILKGAIVLELRLERARTTKDVDLRMVGDPDRTLATLQEAGRLDLGDFLRFEVQDDLRHPEIDADGMVYEGRRYRARAMLAGKVYGSSFGVDVAFAEPMAGEVEVVEGSRFLAFVGVEPSLFRVYPLETHIAEKLHAYTMPRPRPNSRVKDLPDIALLGKARVVEASCIRVAIERTFAHRGTHGVPEAVPQPPASWAPVYERMARIDQLPWPNIDELGVAVAAFLDPVLAGTEGTWDPGTWRSDDGPVSRGIGSRVECLRAESRSDPTLDRVAPGAVRNRSRDPRRGPPVDASSIEPRASGYRRRATPKSPHLSPVGVARQPVDE